MIVVVDYDPKTERRVTVHAFLDTEAEEAQTCVSELQKAHPKREIVLLQAPTWKELRRLNRRYFPVWGH